jgi:polysaccharide deacetylase 2 family uncharacterized protein YibQ
MMAGVRKFFGGVISGGVVAGLTLVVASQLSQPAAQLGSSASEAQSDPGPVASPQPDVVSQAGAKQPNAGPATVVSDATIAAPASEPVAGAAPASGTAADPVAEDAAAAAVPATKAETPAPEQTATEEPTAPLPQLAEVPAVPSVPPQPPQVEVPAQAVPAAQAGGPDAQPSAVDQFVASLPTAPALPGADGAPASAELPPPPPLTPEEEAALADPARLVLPAPNAPAPEAPVPDAPSPNVLVAEADAPDLAPAEAGPAADAAAAEPQTTLPELPVVPAVPETAAPVVDPAPAPEEPGQTPIIVAEDNPDESSESAPARLEPDAGIVSVAPSTLPPSPRLVTADEGALTDRDDSPAENAPTLAEAAPLPEVTLENRPAIERFATAFANPEQKPMFGILLIDTGEPTLDRQGIAALPFPVSIVIDPLLPDAAAFSALYRAGGKEVVMLASGIPERATPADVEQTFQAHDSILPEAVAVVDASVAAFQNNRQLSAQIVPILAEQGRGLLTWDRGLNAADQVARREGLPTATIFRQIDAEGEGVPTMRRYLDRAAFKAAQEGSAVVIGTIRPETIAALLEWTIEGRASTVAIAPASALLQGN